MSCIFYCYQLFDRRGNMVKIIECHAVRLSLIHIFIASLLYYPYYSGFNIAVLFAEWLKLICFNLPFAFFTQLFFIQPLIRSVFKFLYRKDIQAQNVLN